MKIYPTFYVWQRLVSLKALSSCHVLRVQLTLASHAGHPSVGFLFTRTRQQRGPGRREGPRFREKKKAVEGAWKEARIARAQLFYSFSLRWRLACCMRVGSVDVSWHAFGKYALCSVQAWGFCGSWMSCPVFSCLLESDGEGPVSRSLAICGKKNAAGGNKPISSLVHEYIDVQSISCRHMSHLQHRLPMQRLCETTRPRHRGPRTTHRVAPLTQSRHCSFDRWLALRRVHVYPRSTTKQTQHRSNLKHDSLLHAPLLNDAPHKNAAPIVAQLTACMRHKSCQPCSLI